MFKETYPPAFHLISLHSSHHTYTHPDNNRGMGINPTPPSALAIWGPYVFTLLFLTFGMRGLEPLKRFLYDRQKRRKQVWGCRWLFVGAVVFVCMYVWVSVLVRPVEIDQGSAWHDMAWLGTSSVCVLPCRIADSTPYPMYNQPTQPTRRRRTRPSPRRRPTTGSPRSSTPWPRKSSSSSSSRTPKPRRYEYG